MQAQNHKTALLLGATGLVGQHLLALLLADDRYDKVICLLRSPLKQESLAQEYAEKLQIQLVEYEQLPLLAECFSAHHVYVCLGTTIKKAGSQAAFKLVDYDYVLQAAELAAQQQAQSFVWISSIGADADSGNFYLKVKGELEQAIAKIPGLCASPVQPSLLLGERDEFRLGEWFGIAIGRLVSPLMVGPLRKYRPIHALDVARQMIALQRWE